MSATASPAERATLAKSRYRYRLACLAFAVSFLAIAGRLVSLGFAAVEPGAGSLHDISTTVHRPDILDRNGRLLATDIKGATLYADPAKVIDRDELVEQVASVLPDIDTAELREKLEARRGRSSRRPTSSRRPRTGWSSSTSTRRMSGWSMNA
jgi:cell division protein FtsI (penicillin-binding protein 3)